ncbi:cytochrome-c oxidase, cbb3-type subunit III [Sphingomonas pruni]|uniref:cytochrome-c oxidase, cbb3-type subunit III n=1 Tax=Sphingomonas pruni TaxID=40683 RepID=UPI000831F30A|nr:cytochrome-c oxidase, cbb3-type subunit III [Sphingomonas pruni]
MADNKRIDQATGTSTVGHEWDGIEELDTPMPRWWLYIFYACIVFAIGYCIAYPAWPLLTRATPGVLGWTSKGQLEAELTADQKAKAATFAAIDRLPIEDIEKNPTLKQAAIDGGRAAFRINCSACHGSGAAGSKGYPNLNDDDWLWGGDIKSIQQTLLDGVRFPGDDATRMSQMPAFGKDEILKPEEVQDAVSYVRFISHQEAMSPSAKRGSAIFANNCAVCHGANGRGNRAVGAPNLTDTIWLYGGDRDTLTQTVTNARYGIMPAWGKRLDPVTLKMLAVYVHSLGGGEALPAPAATPAATVAAK